MSSSRSLWQQLYATAQQMLKAAHAKLPPWTNAAALAFMAGWAGALLWSHSNRRRWRAQHIRTERAVPLVDNKEDAEECGWLEPFEARICLSRILDSLQETATLVQLAALIAPQIETQAETTAQHAAAAAPHSHAAAAPSSPFQVELEQDLRAHLAKLLAEFRRPGAIEQEFLLFLEHIEARPAQQPHSFTPPVGQKRGSSNHSPKAHANGSVASTLSSSSSLQSSPPPSAISNSSSSQQEEMKDGPPPPAASPSFPPFSSSSSSSSLNLDRKVFRYEFNTAVVLWLESQITKRMFQIEQNNGAGQQA